MFPFTITVVTTVTYRVVVSEVDRSLITVIDLYKATKAINWLDRTTILICTDLDNTAGMVVVNLPL